MYDWEGQAVLDRDGDRIGTIEEIFLVEETGRPEWALVKLGRLKGRTTLVPLRSAYEAGNGVKVSVDKDRVCDAPQVSAEELGEREVAQLYRHYGLDADAGTTNGNSGYASPPPAASVPAPPARGADVRDRPVGELINTVKEEGSTLVGQELKLAKAEMSGKVKDVGIGAGMFGGAGYVGHLATVALMLTMIFALAEVMAPWLAALIVTVLFGAAAAILALGAKKKIQNAGPPIPEQTVESVKQTIETVKEEAKWGLGQTR